MTATVHPLPVRTPHPAPGWQEVRAAIETARVFRSAGEQARRDGRDLSAADLDVLWEQAAASSSMLRVP